MIQIIFCGVFTKIHSGPCHERPRRRLCTTFRHFTGIVLSQKYRVLRHVRDNSVSGISGKVAKFHVLGTQSFTTFICISISGDALVGCGGVERGSGPHLSRPLAMLQTRLSIYNVFIKIFLFVYTLFNATEGLLTG